jgi:pilus assembly protein Flp/PilA
MLAMWKVYMGIQNFLQQEEGQDLVEYALAVALIALGATVGMQSLASGINTAFGNLANTLSTTA